jgi:hypothetical protein
LWPRFSISSAGWSRSSGRLSDVFCIRLLKRRFASIAKKPPGDLWENNFSSNGQVRSQWIYDHAGVVGAERNRAVVTNPDCIPNFVCL